MLPFGVDKTKPRHYRMMLKIAWDNRDNLGYAWKVLSRGVCDGCALGTSGLKDWTIKGTHLCNVRLELLRLNTMPAMDVSVLADIEPLKSKTEAELRNMGRLPYPLRRDAGDKGFARITWEEAYAFAGKRLRETDPDRFCLYLTSRGLTNETYYVAQKMARFLGSPHVENSARLCHSPSSAGMMPTLGVSASTVSYVDWIGTDVLVFFGTNFPNDQPVATKYVEMAKDKGTKVLAVNTYREPGLERYWIPSNFKSSLFGTKLVDRFFSVHQGGDLAFLCAVQKLLIEKGAIASEFLAAHVVGLEELKTHLEALVFDDLVRLSGSTRQDIEDFANILAESKNGIFVWSMGITQHSHGVDTVKALCSLGLLRGYIGRAHAGLVPIRGHSGVQGGSEMGAYATCFPGPMAINEENAKRLEEAYGFPVPARRGRSTVQMLSAAAKGEVDVLYCVGGNFLGTLPRPHLVAEALEKVPLCIHQDILINPSMLLDTQGTVLLLPARTRYEQRDGGTETTTERRVIFSPYIPGHDVGEAKTEWEILQEIAAHAHPERADQIRFESGQAIRDEISRVVPKYKGIENLRKQGDQFQRGGPRLCEGGKFPTPDGKGHLIAVSPPEFDVPKGKFRLATRRGKQFNSMIQGEVDPLTAAKRADVLISQDDAKELGLADGDAIVLENEQGTFHGHAKLAPIRPGNVQGHWPEINVLIPADRCDPYAEVPDYNALVSITKA